MAKKVFLEKQKLFTGKLNLELTKIIIKRLVWSVRDMDADASEQIKIRSF